MFLYALPLPALEGVVNNKTYEQEIHPSPATKGLQHRHEDGPDEAICILRQLLAPSPGHSRARQAKTWYHWGRTYC